MQCESCIYQSEHPHTAAVLSLFWIKHCMNGLSRQIVFDSEDEGEVSDEEAEDREGEDSESEENEEEAEELALPDRVPFSSVIVNNSLFTRHRQHQHHHQQPRHLLPHPPPQH